MKKPINLTEIALQDTGEMAVELSKEFAAGYYANEKVVRDLLKELEKIQGRRLGSASYGKGKT
jgi:hypothetical protein